jgi:phosphatidylinositol alpha-mannosyltransferase
MPQGRTVLWVNRLDPQKGFGVALGAFSRLASRHEDLSLAVIGDGADRAELGLLGPERARVRMLGTVPNEDLPAYYVAADVFVSPAVGQESFGIVLVEAMAAGTPVVASDIPGYRDVVRDGRDGLLVPPRDPEALAEATARVLEDPALAARLSTAGPERASAFSWDAVAPRLEAVYERVSAATR